MWICETLEATDLSKCVPLIFHQDDGEAHRRRSFMVTTFGSAVVHKSPWDSRYLLYCTDNSKCCANTYDTLDSWIAWSFVELGCGKWLGHSPWGEEMGRRQQKVGTPIAGGWIGVLVAHRGDEKALAKSFHVKTTWVSEEVCFSCRASRLSDSENLYTAFGRNAHHRQTIVDLPTFIRTKAGPNPWVRIPGFHPNMIIPMTGFTYSTWLSSLMPVDQYLDCALSFSWYTSHINMKRKLYQALLELCDSDLQIWPGVVLCFFFCYLIICQELQQMIVYELPMLSFQLCASNTRSAPGLHRLRLFEHTWQYMGLIIAKETGDSSISGSSSLHFELFSSIDWLAYLIASVLSGNIWSPTSAVIHRLLQNISTALTCPQFFRGVWSCMYPCNSCCLRNLGSWRSGWWVWQLAYPTNTRTINIGSHSLCYYVWVNVCRTYHKTIPKHTGWLRLVAAVFINACAMRDAVTLRQGPILETANLKKLESSNYLFHSALNWVLS